MITTKVSEHCYNVTLYDWSYPYDDYDAGYIMRNFEVDTESSDEYYWMYFPSSKVKHLTVGDMRKIMKFTAKLNEDL